MITTKNVLIDYLRDVTLALYIQVRDTVGAEVYQRLSEDINKSFSKLIEDKLSVAVMERMDAGTRQPQVHVDADDKKIISIEKLPES